MEPTMAKLAPISEVMAPAGNKPSPSNPADPVVGKEMFLKLLVAQIRHQNPLNPADGVEFLTQLAQFTGLEQMIAMRQQLEAIHAALDPPKATGQDSSGAAEATQGEP